MSAAEDTPARSKGKPRFDRNELRERCRGRWREILIKLGAPQSALTGRDSPCPMCGGTDRFCFSDRDGEGTWYCRGCGGEDGYGQGGSAGFVLAVRLCNGDKAEARRRIGEIVGVETLQPQRPRDAELRDALALALALLREVHRSPAWAKLPLSGHRMMTVIEDAWAEVGGRSRWLTIDAGRFEAVGDRSQTKRARRDLIRRGLIKFREGGRDPETKRQKPGAYQLTYLGMGGAEPTGEWRSYNPSLKGGLNTSKAGGHFQTEPGGKSATVRVNRLGLNLIEGDTESQERAESTRESSTRARWPCKFPCRRVCEITGETRCGRVTPLAWRRER